MPNPITISSYCLRQLLGPIHLVIRGQDGKLVSVSGRLPGEPAPEHTITIFDLPALVKSELGFDTVELCQFHIPDNGPETIAKLERALDAAGVRLANLVIDVGNISDPNPGYREEDLGRVQEWFRAAATLGSPTVRVNSGSFGASLAPIGVTIESYRTLGRAARSLGMQLLVENHFGRDEDPEVVVELVDAVGPDLRVLLDVSNLPPLREVRTAIRENREPAADVDVVYRQVERLAPYARFVHVKTGEFEAPGRPPYYDVKRALEIVRDSRYVGPVSIESVSPEGNVWENARKLRDQVAAVFA